MSGMFDDVLKNVGEPFGGGRGFERGTHEVVICTVNSTQKKTQKNPSADVIEVEVYDPAASDRTAKATLYFHTEGGAKMSVAKILGIMVHNVGEEKKDKVRELGNKLFANISDLSKARDVAANLMADKFVGGSSDPYRAYLYVEPNGSYKTSAYGDLWHYPYEEKAVTADDLLGDAVELKGEDLDGVHEFDDL